jgi:hypothetical protein
MLPSLADRSKRAQQLRQRRDGVRTKPNDRKEVGERILELTPATTLAVILFLLAVGASLATSYILTNRPTCMASTDIAGMKTNLLDSERPQLNEEPNQLGTRRVGSVVSAPQEDTAMPATCTAEQVNTVKEQLVPGGCLVGRPWRQLCSWTHATRGCQDHHWMREVYAKTPFGSNGHKPFVAVFVGWEPLTSKSGFVLNALQLGSHDPHKYDVTKFEGTGCPKKTISFDGSTKGTGTKVFVLENDEGRKSAIKKIKDKFNTGDELLIQSKDFTTDHGKNTLDEWADVNLPPDDPVHHLSINVGGEDFKILMGASNLLKRTRYLDFEVNWSGSWENSSLSILIRKLKARGFVCYFTGDDMLWRVTDCWMNHFSQKNWGRLACVNAHHADVKDVLDRMEGIFLETLTRKISFGD